MATGRIGVTPTLGTRWSKAPAGGTTSLSGLDDNSVSLVYSVGYEQVYRNGVLLSRTNDYTATSGNSITLIDATIAGDIIEVFANELVPLTDAISKGQFTAKGALLSATAASTPGVLTVGSNDQVLTADSSTSTGLKWATPSSGGLTLLSTTTLSGASTTISSISGAYTDLYIVLNNPYASGAGYLRISPNGTDSISHNTAVVPAGSIGGTNIDSYQAVATTNTPATSLFVRIMQYSQTTYGKPFQFFGGTVSSTGSYMNMGGTIRITSAITSMKFAVDGGFSWSGGQVLIYGVK